VSTGSRRMLTMLTTAFLPVTAGGGAAAAVRYCKAPIVVEARGTSEQEARRRALEKWQAEARELGEAWASWRLATPRTIRCARVSGGSVCIAAGGPCAITQNPNRPPRAGGTDI
jgi:hypothetical protein